MWCALKFASELRKAQTLLVRVGAVLSQANMQLSPLGIGHLGCIGLRHCAANQGLTERVLFSCREVLKLAA